MNLKKQLAGGIAIGILVPFVISSIVFIQTNPNLDYKEYFNIYLHGQILAAILSLSLLGNLALFFLFLKLEKEMVSRGIVGSTLLVGVVILILKIMV